MTVDAAELNSTTQLQITVLESPATEELTVSYAKLLSTWTYPPDDLDVPNFTDFPVSPPP